MKEKTNKLAKWWCQLNAWQIPSYFKKRWATDVKNKDYIRGAFDMLDELMTNEDHKEATKIWRKGF